jgi:hypothetical protein
MKKARIMLSVVAVIAIVGTALAFKVAKFDDANIFCSTFTSGDACQKVLFKVTTGVNESNNPCGSNQEFFEESGCETSYTTVAGSGAIVTKIKPAVNQ